MTNPRSEGCLTSMEMTAGKTLMVWFKVDDDLAFHHKTIAAGNAAMGLWVRAGSWSARHLTDGFVPDHVVIVIGTPAQAQRLVSAGLWAPAEDGFRFHDWSGEPGQTRQPSAVEVRQKRAEAAERQRESRDRRRKINSLALPTALQDGRTADDAVSAPDAPISTDTQVNGHSHTSVTRESSVSHASVTAPRPDPYLTTKEPPPTGAPPRKRGTRIPEDFKPTDDMIDWAREKTSHVDPIRETEKFIDYWRAKAGRDAAKIDWSGTWRNWMRNAEERAPTRSQPVPRPGAQILDF